MAADSAAGVAGLGVLVHRRRVHVGDGAVQVCRVKAGVGKDAAGERVVDDVHRVRRVAVAGDAQHGRAPDEQRGLETDCQECQGDRPDLEGCTDPIA